MTRINSAIPVGNLTDEHLLAEHREIKRLPKAVEIYRGGIIPEEFTLGTGHMKFFYDKQKFIADRYKSIHEECVRRGFSVTDFSENWSVVPQRLMGDHIPTESEREILIERITERIKSGRLKTYHYYRRDISKEEAITILKNGDKTYNRTVHIRT